MTDKIRFAPIIRVSTEKAEKKGESLRTQGEQIRQYVKSLNGYIPDNCWEYSGQEHATPSFERRILEKLLDDATKDKFDAVIVADASRWSRDNQRSKAGLTIFKNNDIRFFVGTMEIDLYNPEHGLILGMTTEINEFHARMQALKSITNRINRAKRGIPAGGNLPFGRTFDRTTNTWGVDEDKKRMIEQAAQRYIHGEKLRDIAKTLGLKYATLHRTLTKRCGPEWTEHFTNEDLNIDEKVVHHIPPLLDEETIQAVKEEIEANKTYKRDRIKYKWLLSSLIYCRDCGFKYGAKTPGNSKEIRYYKHSTYNKDCGRKMMIPATELENSVLIELVQTFGDVERLERSIKRATPNMEEIESLQTERAELEERLQTIQEKKENLIDAVAEGLFQRDEIETKMTTYREDATAFQNRIDTITAKLDNMPTLEQVKRMSELGRHIGHSMSKSPSLRIFDKPWKWKKKLVEHALGGHDAEGNPLGIFITEVDKHKRIWNFEIRGALENTMLQLPLDEDYLYDAFGMDWEYQDVKAEMQKIKDTIISSSNRYSPFR